MKVSLSEIADLIGGSITGNKEIEITGLARIEEAKIGDLTFLYMPAYEKYFRTTNASAILVKPGFNKIRTDISFIEVNDPNKAFSKIIIKFFTPDFALSGIEASSFVHTSAALGKNVALGRNVVVSAGCKIGDNVKIFHNTVLLEDVEVGDNSILFQNVSIREKCRIGNRVIIHPGTVIGSDGFGYFPGEDGKYKKIPQIGIVIIEDDVELGSNVSVDRAALGATIIKRGTKIDNLVQIAHNVIIGEDTVISAQSGISGSTKLGSYCVLGGQVGVTGHIEISDNVSIGAQSGVSKSITKPGVYFGSPARDLKTTLKAEAHLRSLPEYNEKIKNLELQIQKLSADVKKLSDKS